MDVTRREFLAVSTAAATGLALGVKPQGEAAPLRRILFLASPASHGYGEHEHPGGCALLADRLDRLDGVRARSIVGWPADESVLADVDALIVFGDGEAGQPVRGHFEALAPLVARGMGVAFVHYALLCDEGPPRKRMLEWIGGTYEPHWSVNPVWTATVAELPLHPVTRGVKPFVLSDEWYYHMRFRPAMKDIVPLLTALPPASSLARPDGPHGGNPAVRQEVIEEKRAQHLAWAVTRPDGGRGLGFTGLHAHWNLAHDGYRTLLLNAACWLAGVPVPAEGVASARPDLEELIQRIGPPPAEWDRAAVVQLLAGWQRP